MDIKHLRYFLAIAEEGIITKAAKRLHMAQPPLSQQLKVLENELQVKLVEKQGRSIRLTEAGHSLQRRAEQILQLVETTENELRGLNEGLSGKLTIGTVPFSGSSLLPERIRIFHDRFPDVYLQIQEGNTYRITQLLETRVIEVGIVRLPVDLGKFDIIRMPTEPIVAIMSQDEDCGNTNEYVQLEDIANKPLMLHRREHGSFIYEMVMKAFQQSGIEPNVVCESNEIMTLLTLADAGIGVTIVPESVIHLRPTLKYKRIIEQPSFETTVAVITLRGRSLSAAAKRFLDLFRSEE